MAKDPMINVVPVTFMPLSSPPRASMDPVPVWCSTMPAPMNSRDLNSEWLRTWRMPPAKPRTATRGLPVAAPIIPIPSR